MAISLSNRVNAVKPSATLVISARATELKAQGKDIISLAAGEPDFNTPEFIKQAGIEAISNNQTRYTNVAGTLELRQAVVDKFLRDNQLSYSTDQVLVSGGGKQSFSNLCQALLNSGDEVIIPAPYWVSYPDMVILADAVPIIVPTGIEAQFKITPQQLQDAITEKTKLLVLNSPSNPTGVCYSKAELQALGEVLKAHPNIVIASDDMYEHIVWSDEPFATMVQACPELYERTIIMNGVSKAYSMTGWRIGYAAGPLQIIKAMNKIQSQSTSNPCSISQVAAMHALNGDQSCISEMLKAFKQRHDYIVDAINAIDGCSALQSQGAFYCFFNVEGIIKRLDNVNDDIELAEYILEQAQIALVPGSAFGAAGYLRLSFATSMELLEKSIARLNKLFA